MRKLIFFLVLIFPLILQAQVRVEQVVSAVDENNDNVPIGKVIGSNGNGQSQWMDIDTTMVDGLSDFVEGYVGLAGSGYASPQTLTYSTTPTMDYSSGETGVITLTGDVTTLTLSNIPDNGKGGIVVIQDATGGYGINAVSHSGLSVAYIDGLDLSSANINSGANGHTVITYWRVGSYLYITHGKFGI